MITPRQRTALGLMGEGFSIDQAANKMHVSRSTVEKLLNQARKRLSANNLKNAVYKAAKMGIIGYCCVSVYNADELRRHTRNTHRVRETYIIVKLA